MFYQGKLPPGKMRITVETNVREQLRDGAPSRQTYEGESALVVLRRGIETRTILLGNKGDAMVAIMAALQATGLASRDQINAAVRETAAAAQDAEAEARARAATGEGEGPCSP